MPPVKGKNVRFRSAYDPPVRVGFATVGESLTNPEFHDDTLIQNMLERYDVEGVLSTVNRSASYGDFTQVTDLSMAMQKVEDAKNDFMTIPSHIREKFSNDPKQFYEFASNEENIDQLIDMGLATQRISSTQHIKNTEVVEPSDQKVSHVVEKKAEGGDEPSSA